MECSEVQGSIASFRPSSLSCCLVLFSILAVLSLQALLDNDFDYSSEEEGGPVSKNVSRQRESRRLESPFIE